MPEWIAQNIGTVLTVGGSIAVAVIGVIGAVWAKSHTPKQPIPIQDVWTENRALRADLTGTERERDDYKDRYEAARDAARALWAYLTRLRDSWGHEPIPQMTAWERRKVQAVITDTDTPSAGTPAPNS